MKFILASQNKHKLVEMQSILSPAASDRLSHAQLLRKMYRSNLGYKSMASMAMRN